MGNSGSASPARLGKDHVPHLEWKIHDFSALLETGAKSAKSSYFQCSGYKWLLQVTPSTKKKAGVETPYVGLCLKLCWTCLEPGHTVNAVFELSVHNHSKKMYCVYKGSFAKCFLLHIHPITAGSLILWLLYISLCYKLVWI